MVVRDLPVSIGPSTAAELATHFPDHDLARMASLVSVPSLSAALDAVLPVMEAVLDALAFQSQMPLHVVALDALDVSPALVLGVMRECLMVANPDEKVAPKFTRLPGNFQWKDEALVVPDLRIGPYPSDTKTRMTLWWYVKSLDAPYAVDKFLCLWTALEILWSMSDVRITEPYQTACHHLISNCPHPGCGQSVERVVRGASLKTFLAEDGHIDGQDAGDLWTLRQVVHGRDVFSPQRTEQLGRLVPTLRAAVLTLLKEALNQPSDQMPVTTWAGGPIINQIVAEGDRPLSGEDRELVALLEGVG